MTLNEKNQNDIFDDDLINELGIEYEFSNEPINRFKNNACLLYTSDAADD